MKNIDEVLKSISNDILTEDAKKEIATLFAESVNEMADTKVKLVVENELRKMDEDHSLKLKTLVESIDNDHVNKFKAVVKKIDEAHTAKLQMVVEKYEKELKEGAVAIRNELVGKISNFLDLYLAESIPAAQLKEAVENIRARKMLEEIKKIVAVDPEFISENFKEALKDGHDTIEKLRGELNEKIKESVNLNQKLIATRSALLLEKKTQGLTDAKKAYVTRLLENKKPEEIEANFKMVVEMFDKDEAEKREVIAESAKSQTVEKSSDTPKAVVTESKIQPDVDGTGEKNIMSSYMDGLKNLDR